MKQAISESKISIAVTANDRSIGIAFSNAFSMKMISRDYNMIEDKHE